MRLENCGLRVGWKKGVNVVADYIDRGFRNSSSFMFSVAAASFFLDQVGGKVHLIIATPSPDGDLALAIAQALTERGYGDRLQVIQPTSVSEYQEELAKVSFIVSSRFHACTLGLISGTPVFGLYFDEHGHKIPGLFNMLGVPDYCQNLSRAAPEAIAKSIIPLFLERKRAFADIPKRLHAMQEETLKWLKQALESKRVARTEETIATSLTYISAIESIRLRTIPDMIQEVAGFKAELNTTRAELDTSKKEITRLRGELSKEQRTLQAVRASLSFQLGNTLIHAVRRPGRNTVLLPYRVFRLGVRAVRKKALHSASITVAKKAHVLEIIKERISEIKREMGTTDVYAAGPRRKDLKIAVIMDEIFYELFKYEANLITFTPENWRQVLSADRPDLLLVDSAWHGNNDTWIFQIVSLGEHPNSKLPELVQWCKTQNIPTAFWNREDSLHYDEFVDTARLFDYVFTTDADCIERYKKDLGHSNVFCLPFAAQPRIHNPVGSTREIRDVGFAGSWYTVGHDDRIKQMEYMLKPVLKYDVDIFDRNFSRGIMHLRFPEEYHPNIVGELGYEDMVFAYKMYRLFLNVNSVPESPTMFAMRVPEVLASGTCILSSYANGIEKLIGSDIVKMSSSPEQTRSHLDLLLGDKELRDKLANRGLRKVMKEHTYRKRLEYVLQKIGMNEGEADDKSRGVSIIISTNKLEYMDNIFASYDRQEYEDKELIIILNNNHLNLAEWREKANSHHNVTVYQVDEKEPLGVCLNYGIERARFDYISKFDDDNYYGPAFLGDLMNAFEYTVADIVGKCAGYIYFENGDILALYGEAMEHCYTHFVLGSAMIIKREVFNRVPWPTDREWGSDTEFLRQSVKNGFKIYSADRFNYVYVRRASQELHTWKITDEEQLAHCRIICNTKDYIPYITC